MRAGERIFQAAKRLRREMTPPEVRLWLRLRMPGEDGPRFRRQHPFGPYVLDFYCPGAGLVVEVDGWGHNMGDQPARDEVRDAWLSAQGLTVVRIPASEVLADTDEVAGSLVRQAMELIISSPAKGGRGTRRSLVEGARRAPPFKT
ncbi:MAG: endonuclease domain-containing protein [Caulobacteraceae bacterium]